jgi:hypothetical protein
MEVKEAVKILKHHNKWRKGADIKMVDPKTLTEAIETIVKTYEKQ